jgi:DNA-binding transcriptional regulator YiaG
MVMLTPKEIRGIRNAMGLSASEFAARNDVTEDTVWKWERGDRHPTYKRMLRLNELRDEVIQKTLNPA